MCSEPPYIGGDPNATGEVNPGINGERFDLWRNLGALYTRMEVALEQHETMDNFMFTHLQERWEDMSRVRKTTRIIRCTPVHRCKSRNEVCQEHRLSTNLLLQELRWLQQ